MAGSRGPTATAAPSYIQPVVLQWQIDIHGAVKVPGIAVPGTLNAAKIAGASLIADPGQRETKISKHAFGRTAQCGVKIVNPRAMTNHDQANCGQLRFALRMFAGDGPCIMLV